MKKTEIVYTTDLHGSLMSHNYVDGANTYSGLVRLSSLLKQKRQENPDLILIDNGDINQGTPLVTYDQKYDTHTMMAKALNQLNYTYSNLGNHDFNYGIDNLNLHINHLNSKLLTSNIELDNTSIGQTQYHKTTHGTIAFIGVVTDYLINWEQPETLSRMKITSVLETVKKEIYTARLNADYIIVAYHGGLERDPITLESTETLNGENIGIQLVLENPEIDVLLTGHQHRSLVTTLNQTLIVQAGFNGQQVGLIELDETGFIGHLLDLSNYPIDVEFEKNFTEIEAKTQTWLDEVIGYSESSLLIDDLLEAQKQFHPLAQFINQVLLEYTQADIAFSSFFNTTIGFDRKITYRQLIANYPFPNTLFVKKVPGTILLQYLEKNANYWDLDEENQLIISFEKLFPKLQYYDYDFVTGIHFDIDVSQPVGQRIVNHNIDPLRNYSIVMNNYRAQGGSDSWMLKETETIYDDGREVIDILYDYLLNHQPITIKPVYLTQIIY